MVDEWIIRVEGRDYGPVDVTTLREWKSEGRVLSTNEVRRSDNGDWITAGEIPGLFETAVPPVQTEAQISVATPTIETAQAPQAPKEDRPRVRILSETFRIYGRGFFKFLGLTLLVVGPSICAQFTGVLIDRMPNSDVDLGKLVAGAFAFCMTFLTLALWPVYVAGIQILSAELRRGNRIGFLSVLNEAMKFWPRVAGLCLVVYGVFFLLTVLALGIMAMIVAGAGSLVSIFIALVLLAVQVWLFGRWFINVLFWQQAAVLENAGALESLSRSKQMARSGGELPWYRRPMWRGIFIASIWTAFALAIETAIAWPSLQQSLPAIMAATDPQAMIEAMKNAQTAHGLDVGGVVLGVMQAIVRPLLGIAFVLLYFDSKA